VQNARRLDQADRLSDVAMIVRRVRGWVGGLGPVLAIMVDPGQSDK
jgi:hypothetical protein